MRKEGLLKLIYQMSNETVKKYRISAAGFLGELLLYSSLHCPEKL